MHTYETLFITLPTLTDDEENVTVGSLAQVVAEGGGRMIANDRMGRRRLAYPIRKFDDGVYTRFLYDSETEVPRELERRIRLSDKILRSLTVRLEEDWAEFSKEEAVREAQRREREEAEREAEEAAAAEKAAASDAAEAPNGSGTEPETATTDAPTEADNDE